MPRPIEGGDPTADIINESGGEAVFEKTDVARWEDIDCADREDGRALWPARHHGEQCRHVFRHGARSIPAPSSGSRSWRVNLTGMFNGCKRAIQQMLTQEPRNEVRGRLINLGSQHGDRGGTGRFALWRQQGGSNLFDEANRGGVCEGSHRVQLHFARQDRHGQARLGDGSGDLDYARRRTPWPRLGRPQDIANAAVFLASDRATFMTGSNLVVDGGWLAG